MDWTLQRITTALASMSPWRKRFYWWPTQRWVLQDPVKQAFCREAARLSQSIGIAVPVNGGTDKDCVDAAVRTIQGLPKSVEWTLSSTPYHNVPGSEKLDEWGAPHQQELSKYLDSLWGTFKYLQTRQRAEGMENKVGLIFLDTEQGTLMPTGEATHDAAAVAKLEVFYRETKNVCKKVLGYEVPIVWYSSLGMDLHGNWRKNSVVPRQTPADYYCVPLYQWEDPHLCVEIYNRSLALAHEHDVKTLIPIVCLAGGYHRSFNAWVNAGELAATQEYPRLGSWLAGRYIHWSPWLDNDESGRFEAAPFGIFWPGMLLDNWRYWPLHFLSFAYGAANQATIPEGEPA